MRASLLHACRTETLCLTWPSPCFSTHDGQWRETNPGDVYWSREEGTSQICIWKITLEGGPRDAAQYLFSVTLVLTQGRINDLKQHKA